MNKNTLKLGLFFKVYFSYIYFKFLYYFSKNPLAIKGGTPKVPMGAIFL